MKADLTVAEGPPEVVVVIPSVMVLGCGAFGGWVDHEGGAHTNGISALIRASWRRKWQPTPVLLPWKSHGWEEHGVATVYGVAKSQARLSDLTFFLRASQVAQVVKNLPANTGDIRDTGSVPGLGRSPGGGHGNPLQYSCLENPMDRGAWRAIVHGLAKSWTQQKWLSMHAYTREGQESLSAMWGHNKKAAI